MAKSRIDPCVQSTSWFALVPIDDQHLDTGTPAQAADVVKAAEDHARDLARGDGIDPDLLTYDLLRAPVIDGERVYVGEDQPNVSLLRATYNPGAHHG